MQQSVQTAERDCSNSPLNQMLECMVTHLIYDNLCSNSNANILVSSLPAISALDGNGVGAVTGTISECVVLCENNIF